jgi:two-component system LytT family response regulator
MSPGPRRNAVAPGEHDEIEVIGECDDGATAVMTIRDVKPDLVFLDVQMSGLDGFGVLRAIGTEHMPIVVFVTAYDQFALQAFEAHAIDYLLKPIDPDRLDTALERVRNQIEGQARREREDRVLSLLSQVGGQPRYIERLVTRSDGKSASFAWTTSITSKQQATTRKFTWAGKCTWCARG